ncbi:hypothetical protein Pint_02438 [Pistacia integerrima]|uniref:Uncharacterized protein n=2 Tax=Pistacia integerrima TaxID=434235 RepID=A0ACC0ZM22_9ROSI|nr:hypothetical protein Pint_02437 [Pistacia integerrima]KAJ0054165.1 hypothetical protein Pint_02438 [Pistacia integerrima]
MIFLLKLLIVSSMMRMWVSAKAIGRVDVSINNYLQNKLDLTVHCKSANDDLGEHIVPYLKNYTFTFKKRFFQGTLFFCSFQWNGPLHWFDIYDQSRDDCDDCLWEITETGPCFYSQCYEWNKS